MKEVGSQSRIQAQRLGSKPFGAGSRAAAGTVARKSSALAHTSFSGIPEEWRVGGLGFGGLPTIHGMESLQPFLCYHMEKAEIIPSDYWEN